MRTIVAFLLSAVVAFGATGDGVERSLSTITEGGNVAEVTDSGRVFVQNETPFEISQGAIKGHSKVHKFYSNEDVDAGTEDAWSYGGTLSYLTTAETLDVGSSNAQDDSTTTSSGTATGGSSLTLVDSGATFSSDGVAAGDILINDTKDAHGIVSSVDSETQLTVKIAMNRGSQSGSTAFVNESGDAYRVVTTNGTGAATVVIFGLNAGYTQVVEYVAMNGASDVTTSESFIRVYRMIVLTAGSSGSPAADILGTASVSSSVQVHIMASDGNKTLMSHYTVPAGKSAYIMAFSASTVGGGIGVNAAETKVKLLIAPFGEVFELINIEGLTAGGSSFINKPIGTPIRVPELTDIRVEVTTDTNNTKAYGSYDLILIDN